MSNKENKENKDKKQDVKEWEAVYLHLERHYAGFENIKSKFPAKLT